MVLVVELLLQLHHEIEGAGTDKEQVQEVPAAVEEARASVRRDSEKQLHREDDEEDVVREPHGVRVDEEALPCGAHVRVDTDEHRVRQDHGREEGAGNSLM